MTMRLASLVVFATVLGVSHADVFADGSHQPGQPEAQAATPAATSAIRIVILGDSTVSNYPANSPFRGWGQVIGEGFKPGVTVRNLAVSGRSTKTFLAEGRLKSALKEPADFALIQFGHNDSHGKGRPEATDPDTDFKANLRTYIDTFRDAGVQPILVTPMHRRTYLNGRLTEELKPYADAVKAVALEEGVPVVDLYTSSGILFETLGEEAGSDLNVSKTDRTHFSEKGARAMATLVLKGLQSISSELAEQIR